MHLVLIEVIGALVTLLLVCAIVPLLRTLALTHISDGRALGFADLNYRPMQRLLDPAEFRYLRDHGISKEKVNTLRRQRRTIYRLYLRDVAQEFNRVHSVLRVLLVSSYFDRPDLAKLLAKQTFTFYPNLLLVEVRLTLYACGFEKMPKIDVLGPLEMIQAQLRQLTPATMAVSIG